MKRSLFLLISALLAWLFGITMMFAPEKMLANLTAGTGTATEPVMQWVGVGLFSIGCINFFGRNDTGSPALKGILTGNLLLHIIGMGFDLCDYARGFMNSAGLSMGIVVHSLLIIGFGYYLVKMPKAQA